MAIARSTSMPARQTSWTQVEKAVRRHEPSAARTAADPTTVALEALARLEAAWNDADGEGFGASYTRDPLFVNIRGELIVGRAAIAAGHAGIFSTIYAGSVNRMELVRATSMSEGIIVAVSVNTLDCPSGPLRGVHKAMSTSIISMAVDGPERAQILSSHNTLVTV